MEKRSVFLVFLVFFGCRAILLSSECFAQYSDGFNYPVGPYICKPQGTVYECLDHIDRRDIGNFEGYRVDQDFLNNNPSFGNKPHLGVDINREVRFPNDTTYSGNRDLGDPVFAVSNGEVVFAQNEGDGWGNVVIIRHIAPASSRGFVLPRGGGTVFQVYTLYGHLEDSFVASGELVEKGQMIGTIGDADGVYTSCTSPDYFCAHLHFEVYTQELLVPGDGYAWDTSGYTYPLEFVSDNRMIFGDVDEDAWFYGHVFDVTTSRIVNGEKTPPDEYGNDHPTGLFRPERSITRAEFLKMVLLSRDIDIIPVDHALGPVFNDVPMSHPLFEYVYTALFAGVIDDLSASFYPDEFIIRQDAMEMLMRAFSFAPPDGFYDFNIHDFFDDIYEWSEGAYYIKLAFLIGNSGETRGGIIGGYPDHTFRPDRLINRAEAAKIMKRAMECETPLH